LKIHRIVCLSALLAFPQFAVAECPKASSLAQVEGILDYCAQVDPALAPRVQQFKSVVLHGVPEKELEVVVQSKDFKQTYTEIRQELSKVPTSTVISACTSTLGGK